jgi:hypothetical protein
LSLTIFGVSSFPCKAQKVEIERLPSLRGVKQIDRTQSIPSETYRDTTLERAILRENPDYSEVANDLSQYPQYYYNKIDLNGDNIAEVIVFIEGLYFCGSGGCTTLIFQKIGQDYRLVSSIGVSRPPIIVRKNKTLGWNDLVIFASGGGGRTAAGTSGYYLLRFNGKEYPASPDDGIKLSSNSTITGTAFFSNSGDINRGLVLQPLSTNSQIVTGRSPNRNQSPTRTASGQEVVASNLECTSNLRNILGQGAPDYCTSAQANSGILFDKLQVNRNSDRSIKLEMRVFNRGSADGFVEVYDSSRRLVDVKIIDGNILPTGLIQSGRDLFTKVPASFFSRYPLGDSRRELKEQNVSVTIPSGGSVQITKSSNTARLYNTAMLAVEVAMIAQGDPEFTKSETVRKFLVGFAQEFGTKATMNIFKGEPSIQGVFSLDFIDKNKLAEVLQKLVQYSVTIENDPFKNPLLGAFSDVSLDAANIGIENVLDKYILPGLGTLARGVRVGGNAVNTFARSADLSNATVASEKATVTLRDAASRSTN